MQEEETNPKEQQNMGANINAEMDIAVSVERNIERLKFILESIEVDIAVTQNNIKTLRDQLLERNLEQIFRLLGLRYPSKDIYNAYQGIISNKKILRASAVEFLDNVLGSDFKKYILPVLEQDYSKAVIKQSEKLFNIRIENISQALEILIKGEDTWLKACALFIIPEEKLEDLKYLVKEAIHDRDPVVRETAELVINRI